MNATTQAEIEQRDQLLSSINVILCKYFEELEACSSLVECYVYQEQKLSYWIQEIFENEEKLFTWSLFLVRSPVVCLQCLSRMLDTFNHFTEQTHVKYHLFVQLERYFAIFMRNIAASCDIPGYDLDSFVENYHLIHCLGQHHS